MGFAAAWTRTNRVIDEMMEAAQLSTDEQVVDLALGDPDIDTDARITAAAFADAEQGYTHYAPARGDADLLFAIRETWKEDLEVAVAEDELMVTTSGCHAMWLLLSAIIDPGDEVVIFSPYFSPYPEQIRLAGGISVEVPTHADAGFIPDPQMLEDAITDRTKAIIVNSPCNPTGAVLSANEMRPLLALCEAHDLLYIADDIYTFYGFARPFVAAATLPESKGRIATIRSFSKDFCMSGWRLGYVVAPSEVISAMMSVNESNVYVAPSISQRAAYHALGLREDIGQRINRCYQGRMEYVASRVAAIPYLSLPSAQGGLYAFIDISKSGETSSSFTQKLREKYQVSVIPGTAFGVSGEGYIRMALRQDETVLSDVFDALEHDAEWNEAAARY